MTNTISDDLQQIGTFNTINDSSNIEMSKCSDCSIEISEIDNYCQFCGSQISNNSSTKIEANTHIFDYSQPTDMIFKHINQGNLTFSIGIMLLNGILYGLFNYIQAIKKEYIIASNVDPEYASSFFSESAILKDAIYEFIFGFINIIIVWYFLSEILNLILRNNLKDRNIVYSDLKRRIRILIGVLNYPLIILNLSLIVLILFEENQVYLVSINYDTIIGPKPEAKLIRPFSSTFLTIRIILTAIFSLYTIYLFDKGIKHLNYHGDLVKIVILILIIITLLPLITII